MRRSPMRIKKYGCVGFLALVGALGAGPVRACAQDVPAARLDSLRTELEVLRARLDSLEGVVVGGQAEDTTDAIARLRSAAQAAAGDAAADTVAQGGQDFVGRARSLQALNPELSRNGDLYGSIHSDNPRSENFIPREFEFACVAALDPYARAKVFLAVEEDRGRIEVFPGDPREASGAAVGVEEGYVEWVALPGGLRLKVGRFSQQFGQLNRWHSHALHFQSRSLPHLAFIGEGALAQDGASVHWLLPTGESGAYAATVELTRSRNEVLFGEAHSLSYLGHMNAFWQLSPSTDLDLGLSALFGDYQDVDGRYDNRLFGVEMAFNWAPQQQSLYRGIVMRGGVMLSDPEAVRGLRGESAWGIWSLAEIKLSQQWVAGGRYDWVENPEDPSESAWLASPTLTYWQSEYVRLRAEYDILGNPGKTTRQFTLRITFAMGPHKHETY